MKILFVGDIVGNPGRTILRQALSSLVAVHGIDLVVANVENAAGGFGITREVADAIRACGVDVMTTGNHVWDKKEALDLLTNDPTILRPANFPPGAPGRGHYVARTAAGDRVGIINVMGRVFMTPIDDPFAIVLTELEKVRPETQIVLVDMHAEATSEKLAMGWHLDGRVTAVVGTHTHVQTADARVLPGGTAYITDVGMTGPHDSIIGVEKEAALRRFRQALPSRFETAKGDPRLHAVIVSADTRTGLASGIERLSLTADDVTQLVATTESRR